MNLLKFFSEKFLHQKKLKISFDSLQLRYLWRITRYDEVFQIYGNSSNKEWYQNWITCSFWECCQTALLSSIPTTKRLKISGRIQRWSVRVGLGPPWWVLSFHIYRTIPFCANWLPQLCTLQVQTFFQKSLLNELFMQEKWTMLCSSMWTLSRWRLSKRKP